MATAERIPQEPKPDRRGVKLELTYEEAVTLRCLTGGIAGDPISSPRQYTDAIGRALGNAGIRYTDKPVYALREGGFKFLEGSAV